MICGLILRRYSLYMLFLLFFSVFFTCLSTRNVSAVSDYTYTFDLSSIPSWYTVCGTSSSDPAICSDYSYLIVSPNASSTNLSFFYSFGLDPAVNIPIPSTVPSIFPLSSSVSQFILTGSKQGNATGTITLTLTDSFSSGSVPSGSISITENGSYDVSSYAEAVVDIPPVSATYHEDLENINHSITVCAAVILVLYFFYCIYRLIIKNSGVH